MWIENHSPEYWIILSSRIMTERRLILRLVNNLSEPLFGKEGYGEILWRIDLFKKSPSIPLCQRGKMQGGILYES